MATSRKRKPKTHETYIKAALRRIWGWFGERKKAKVRAQVGKDSYGVHLFRCEECERQPLSRAEVEIDHIVPVMPVTGWDGDWTGYIERLFCSADGLLVKCKPCHSAKSIAENASRRATKKGTQG